MVAERILTNSWYTNTQGFLSSLNLSAGNEIQIQETYDICKYTPEYLPKAWLISKQYF